MAMSPLEESCERGCIVSHSNGIWIMYSQSYSFLEMLLRLERYTFCIFTYLSPLVESSTWIFNYHLLRRCNKLDVNIQYILQIAHSEVSTVSYCMYSKALSILMPNNIACSVYLLERVFDCFQ